MLELGVKFLLSYFLGSVMGAMVVGRIRGGVDIRTMGSGNAGGTNALRTQGAVFALGVVLIDVGKGVIGAGLIPVLDLPFIGIDPGISRTWLALSCAPWLSIKGPKHSARSERKEARGPRYFPWLAR